MFRCADCLIPVQPDSSYCAEHAAIRREKAARTKPQGVAAIYLRPPKNGLAIDTMPRPLRPPGR
jgi:hypothetical protein